MLIYPAREGHRIVTLRELEDKSDEIEIGELRNVYIGGSLYTAARDAQIAYSSRATISRHLDDLAKRIQNQGRNIILGKRWLEGEAYLDDNDQPAKKRRKIQESQDIIYDEGTLIDQTTDIFDETVYEIEMEDDI